MISDNNYILIEEIDVIKNIIYRTRAEKYKFIPRSIISLNFGMNSVYDSKLVMKNGWAKPQLNIVYNPPNVSNKRTKLSLNNTNNTPLTGEISQEESLFGSLPDEIIERILLETFPFDTMDLMKFSELKFVCKTFYRVTHNYIFINKLFNKTNPYLLYLIKCKFIHLECVPFNVYSNIFYFYSYNLIKDRMVKLYGCSLINALGGYRQFMSIPVISLRRRCIDNLCGSRCINRFHKKINKIKSPISRGIDIYNRPFIFIIYRSLKTKRYYYEIIYKNNIPDGNITFSGIESHTNIGNLSIDYSDYNSAAYRPLKYRSFDYIKRLVQGEKTGEVYYNYNLNKGIESTNNLVKLDFDYESLHNQMYSKTI